MIRPILAIALLLVGVMWAKIAHADGGCPPGMYPLVGRVCKDARRFQVPSDTPNGSIAHMSTPMKFAAFHFFWLL